MLQGGPEQEQEVLTVEPGEPKDPVESNRKGEYMSTMLEKHLPLVKVIVAKIRPTLPTCADLEELHSAGVMGLISAIDRYDPSRGYCFETYASIRVRGSILDELRKLDLMPRSARSKYRKLNRVVESLEQKLGRAPTDREICDELNMSMGRYLKLRADAQPLNLLFLDRNQNMEVLNQHDMVPDERQIPCFEKLEREELTDLVKEKIEDLPRRQRLVLALYYYEGMRLAEIGEILGVSEARISQIRAQALKTLRLYVNRMVDY